MARIQLGDRVKCTVTGIEGVVTGMAKWITGCDTASVRGDPKDGKMGESWWVDEHSLQVIKKGAVQLPAPEAPVTTVPPPKGGPPTRSPK